MRRSRSARSLPFRSATPNPRSPDPQGHIFVTIPMLDNLAPLDYFRPSNDRIYRFARKDSVMHWLALGMALLVGLAIIAIGIGYVASPTTMTRSFGLPLPESGTNIAW